MTHIFFRKFLSKPLKASLKKERFRKKTNSLVSFITVPKPIVQHRTKGQNKVFQLIKNLRQAHSISSIEESIFELRITIS